MIDLAVQQSRLDELERATDEDLKRTPHELLVRWVAESLPDEGGGYGDRPPDFAALSGPRDDPHDILEGRFLLEGREGKEGFVAGFWRVLPFRPG